MLTPTFKRITVEQFRQLLIQFNFTRQITSVHMHHTWRPRRSDFRGHDTIVAMWRHHTQTKGWSDIAQHITIDPEGMIWLGRNWNRAPASAAGHNGNGDFGPFMFEMVGDFDIDREPFDGPQKQAALEVIAAVQQKFGLAGDTLRFHDMMSSKSCPGSAIRYAEVLAEVEMIRQQRAAAPATTGTTRRRAGAKAPFPDEFDLVVREAMAALSRPVPAVSEPGDAELSHDEHEAHAAEQAGIAALHAVPGAARSGVPDPMARGSGLSLAQLAQLRPHLVNLNAGRFSTDGEVTTSPADVDSIFDEHLPRALHDLPDTQPLKLLFYAHGGLIKESVGLQIAHQQVNWWMRNGVYPVHFVWETGLVQILKELLNRQQAARGLNLQDIVLDPLLQGLAHMFGGVKIWGGMKANAERASDLPTQSNPIGGGAYYVASRLQAFCDAHPGRLELHAVGHSAGSVFHAYFLPMARRLGVPRFKSAHFMAPAVRVDTFKDQLLPLIGNDPAHAVESLTLFTMRREYERRDQCGLVYGKSLLYLIHHALEAQTETPILGLEDSLRADAQMKALFGLSGTPSIRGEVIWSPTLSDSGRSASRATAHGDFDDDAATMNSLARRILGKADADAIVDYPPARSRSTAQSDWLDEIDWPEPLRQAMSSPPMAVPTMPPRPVPVVSPPAFVRPDDGRFGRRMAVCVGIDTYPHEGDRLGGCVNDARSWSRALATLGFETQLLLDTQATRQGIELAVGGLIDRSRPGDVIVFQYAGHGTHLDDLDGDEEDGQDEALCPVDFRDGALFLDDDIGRLLARVPDGVNLTLFMDCCHSGTIARFALGAPARQLGARARYIQPTPTLQQAHRTFRAHESRVAGPRPEPSRVLRDVKFSACQDHELALESGGNGEFTRRALRLLHAGIDGVSHEQFQQRLIEAFGPNPAQTPRLDCVDGVRSRGLLLPLTHSTVSDIGPRVGGSAASAETQVLEAVHLMSRAIQTLTAR